MKKILIVDDEKDIVLLLKDYFELNNYIVITAYNGKEALEKIEKKPDIIILDISMPDIDGIEVCKTIRNYISCPILFLTAKIEEVDKIKGFNVGGDDYIIKPFNIRELGARVSAHLRRENRIIQNSTTKFIDSLAINYTEKTVTYLNEIIIFTKKEFEIIELLSLNIGQVFDKERIYEIIWGFDSEGDSKVVVEHIRRIRQKFFNIANKEYIDTVWGVGYKWAK